MTEAIKIKCNGNYEVSLDELNDFQGNLKTLTAEGKERLKKSIIEKGFSFPFLTWKDKKGKIWINDGHQRTKVLKSMQDEGYKLPDKFPACEIFADTKKEAAEKILIQSDVIGKFNELGLHNFVTQYEIDLPALNIELPNIDFDKFKWLNINEKLENRYSEFDNYNYENAEKDGIDKIVGYNLSSIWICEPNQNYGYNKYLIPLPENKKNNPQYKNYSRTSLTSIIRIIKTYMREGDYFLESCCGWGTFSGCAKYYNYDGIGIDIWDIAINNSKKQINIIPNNNKVEILEMDAMKMKFKNNTFDFIYCNPPFLDAELYGTGKNEIASKDFDIFKLNIIKLMNEHYRVLKNKCLCTIIINDKREKGILISLQKVILDSSLEAGFKLYDFVISNNYRSRALLMRKKAYKKKHTAKTHEYVITFIK